MLLVPFRPDALVTAFIDELYKRIAKQGLAITPNTHIATLHIDCETGALIDAEDLLSDVIDPKTEKIFSVFDRKDSPKATATAASHSDDAGPSIPVRVVTPSTANDREKCPIVRMPLAATIQQLHDKIAEQLQIPSNYDTHADTLECNCKWANVISAIPTPPKTVLVVSGKSNVESLPISTQTEAAVKAALRSRFGDDYEMTKRLALVGANVDINNRAVYKKVPIAAICSKQRHTPVHARVDIDESGHRRSKVLDLHTSEIPISSSCMNITLENAGLMGLIQDGIVEIFAVSRTTTGQNAQPVGKSSIFRARAHWEPRVTQSDRGMAMFLSSLRVFTSLVQGMSDDERAQDAVLHAFDLLTNFPPALRALHILTQGKTPTTIESAALSAAMFQALNSFAPEDIIGSDKSRVFELSRLFFGSVLEKARTLKLPDANAAVLPYLSNLQSVDLADYKTGEAVMNAMQTSEGLVESAIFRLFESGALLQRTHLNTRMVKMDIDPGLARLAVLSGGTIVQVTAFSRITNYRYADAGDVNAAIDLAELSELNHLAELCGRNRLAVHKPSQLSSAVTPCLTFDRNAHLAVYTGEQPCGAPGQSSILFRPQHGDDTIDAAVIEQLIAPILQYYESDGTAVFDALGGAAVRRLENPDEILMFCVDNSASMRQPTDFEEVNDVEAFASQEPDIQSYVEADFYNRASFEEMKEQICQYEGFDDMVAMVASAEDHEKRYLTTQVLDILRRMLSTEIIKKSEDIANRRASRYYGRNQINALESELSKVKIFWAGLKTHESSVRDFLMYRAASQSRDITQRWTWSIGDGVPASSPMQHISELPADVTDLPDRLRCPISHTLMENAVTAKDGHTYSASAIRQWFTIRKSSPMTGLELQDTSLDPNSSVSDAATSWAAGEGIIGRGPPSEQQAKRSRSEDMEVTFDSRYGSFSRRISPNLTLKQLYMLAFRGLKGRTLVFQLTTDRYGSLPPSPEAVVSWCDVINGDRINVRIAEDDPDDASRPGLYGNEKVLVKVYANTDEMLFGYWVKRENSKTMVSLLWKYWRYMFRNKRRVSISDKQVWADVKESGDGLWVGSPLADSEMMANYLTRTHCSGHLGPEKLFKEDLPVVRSNAADQPLVLKMKVNPPWKPHRKYNKLTRLDVLKQMFEAVINRMLAYNLKTHCGLITFASTPKVAMNISHVLENFRRSTQDMKADGNTALWDAMALGQDQIVEYGKKYPQAKKRIVVISDGEDTNSISNKANEISWKLRHNNIAVDTISLGDEDNADLRTISYLAGCYSLHPTSLMNALATTEMEPFLSLTERPPIVPVSSLEYSPERS